MNMRRYSMKARRVTALKRLLRNDRVRITRIVVAAHEKKEDMVYVFFDNVEEMVAKEKETVARLKKKAEEVAKDKVYAKLSNSKQRELYLLDHYGLSKREGVDVIELLKIAEVEASVALNEKLLTARVKLEVEESGTQKGPKQGKGRREKRMNKHWKVEIWIDEELEGFDGEHLTKSDFDAVKEEIDAMWHGVKVVNYDVHEEKEEKR